MLTMIGILLTLGGVATALTALLALRGGACPTCEATGTLEVVRLVPEETPGFTPTVVRTRQCLACGANVVDRRQAPTPRLRVRATNLALLR